MAAVGFSTGCLYKTGLTIGERISLYLSMGADAVELSFATPSELLSFELTQALEDRLAEHSVVTIHAPWKKVRYSPKASEDVISRLSCLSERLSVCGIVVHPDTVESFSYMEDTGLPFRLENMDGRKVFGTHPDHFFKLVEHYSFKFVLDVQHIYEHDPTMSLADEFLELWGSRLGHMHVSGCKDGELHVPTHLSDNRECIERVLKLGIDVPKILEGTRDSAEDMASEEVGFIRGFEKG